MEKGTEVMNENHLQQIFENYIERFEEFNGGKINGPTEYYKWEMPIEFKSCMDRALGAEDKEVFSGQMTAIAKLTRDFIDSGKTLPFAGLIRITDKEWETVQEMFKELFANDNGDVDNCQRKIETFLMKSRRLEEKYKLSSLYKNDYRAVTTYLFLYNPENNYIYKPTHAQNFQDCIEFYKDFGEGDHVNLKNYYCMCDQLVEAIKKNSAIQGTEKLRSLKFKKKPHPDIEKHILAYDIIYCCSAYNLFRGITFKHLTPKERNVMLEKQQKAQELFEKLKASQEKQRILDAAMNEIEKWFCVGKAVVYKGFGKGIPIEDGIIIKKSEDSITVEFSDGSVKSFGLFAAIINGYVRPKEIENSSFVDAVEVLRNKSSIENSLSYAEKQFALYSEYI